MRVVLNPQSEIQNPQSDHHFILLKIEVSVDWRFRKIIIKMARPTATSAAATAMMKNTKTCAEELPHTVEKATMSRFTALSISSMHMNFMMAFLRNITPNAPMLNRAAERRR